MLDAAGGVSCWGCNGGGQLGDGTTADRATPVKVAGLDAVTQLSLGAASTCAIEASGRVKCWGENGHLELGRSGYDSAVPSRVPNVDDAVRITVGKSSACALERDGALYCWGDNKYWDTGLADYGDQVAMRIDDTMGIEVTDVHIDTSNNGCVLDRAGTVTCWGPEMGNWSTVLPSNATNEERVADHAKWGSQIVRATGIRAFVDDAKGVCVRPWDSDGAAWSCLGFRGAIEPGQTEIRGQLAIGGSGGCAAAGGRARCWGRADDPIQGIGAIEALTDVEHVAVGSAFACALRTGGAIACWGNPDNWRTGDATMALSGDPSAPPGAAPRLDKDIVVEASEPDCRIAANRTVQCRERGRWRTMARMRDIAQLSYGDSHVCARSDGGAVWCWGAYYFGSYHHDGEYTEVQRPHRIRGLRAMTIASWGERDCAVTTSNDLNCWGRGISEMLEPVYLYNPSTTAAMTRLTINDAFLCGWQSDSEARCWPTYDLIQKKIVEPMFVLDDVAALDVAGERGCALLGNGTIRCWGKAIPGDGSWSGSTSLAEVAGITTGLALGVGPNHACALTLAGEVWCWGENAGGQLGDGTTRDRVLPVRATFADKLGEITGVTGYHDLTAVTTKSGESWIWGASD